MANTASPRAERVHSSLACGVARLLVLLAIFPLFTGCLTHRKEAVEITKCVANLRQINEVLTCCIPMEHKMKAGDPIPPEIMPHYFKTGAVPRCPSGPEYRIPFVAGGRPACPRHGDILAPYPDCPVDIAVNLGSKSSRDLGKLWDSLAEAGIPRWSSAVTLNTERIFVDRADFKRAQQVVRETVVRDRLTVRVYTSPDFKAAPESALLEVWVKGRKVREEEWKVYW